MNAQAIIKTLGLEPHPEGGWFRQTWIAEAEGDDRPVGTSIYYLLEKNQRSHWHRVDAVEIWHWYAGAPLRILQSESDTGPVTHTLLGPDLQQGQQPQIIVPAGHWQSTETITDWALVGCTVSPGFRFDGFVLAPEGWQPG